MLHFGYNFFPEMELLAQLEILYAAVCMLIWLKHG